MKRTLGQYDFSGGLNNREAPYLIRENELADCQNVTFREGGKVKTRQGHENYKTLPAVSGMTEIDDCDSTTGWSADVKGSLSSDASNKYEGTASIKNTKTIGEEVNDCDSATGWSGHDGIQTSSPSPYEGTGCVRDKAVLGEVFDNCDSTSGWNYATLQSGQYEGSGCLRVHNYNFSYKNVSKDYSMYQDDALFSIWMKVSGGPASIQVIFATDASNYYYKNFTVSSSSWQQFTCYKSEFTASGSPSWANISQFAIGRSGGPYSYYLDFDYITWQEKGRTLEACTYTPGSSLDWSYLCDNAKISLYLYAPSDLQTASVTVRPYDGSAYYYKQIDAEVSKGGQWQQLNCQKSDFSKSGSPNWNSIDSLQLCFSFAYSSYKDIGTTVYWYYDIIKWEEKDLEQLLTRDWSDSHKDFSSVGNGSEISLWFRYHAVSYCNAGYIQVYFYDGDAYFYKTISLDISKTDTFQKVATTKGEFEKSGSPSWDDIDKMVIGIYLERWDYSYLDSIYDHIDYIVWQYPSSANKITGLYEFVSRNQATKKKIACIDTKIYDLDTETQIQRSAGMTAGYDYSFATMANKVFAANGVDKMQYWNGSDPKFADVGSGTWPSTSNTPPECKYITVHKNRLWCFGCTASGLENYLVWSEMGDPTLSGQWPSNNWMYISPESGDRATGLAVFSDSLVIFKDKSLWLLLGDDEDNWNLNHLEECPGCVAPKSIAVSEDGVYYLGNDGIYLFNGQRSVNVCDAARNTFKDEIDRTMLSSAVGVYYDGQYILWMVEENGASGGLFPDMALVYDPKMGNIARWRGMEFNVFAVMGGKLYGGICRSPSVVLCFQGYNDNGQAIETIVKTRQYNLGIPEKHKFFHHLYVVAEAVSAAYGLSVTAHTQEDAETRSYSFSLQDLDKDLVRNRMTIALRGDYLQIEFSHSGVNEPISLLGFTLGYTVKRVK